MSLAEICPLSEIIAELGLGDSVTDKDRSLLNATKSRVENAVRQYLDTDVSQPSSDYVLYLPNRRVVTDANEFVDVTPQKRVTFRLATDQGDVLQLPMSWVRSITEVREDYDAYGGQGSSVFTSDTLLVAGQDYWLDEDSPGMSRTGHVMRIGAPWSPVPR
ncbi:MAG TPA: hypothetical protein VL475_05305, partial [Planctomycetaceae bacterium]|nr:hypothetical protein [Planctomycetaceae bacterium]